jgi:2-polyprenyl-3-methyl-5-hydroxy-6-metoxy-1,4-benzoquinol methylase
LIRQDPRLAWESLQKYYPQDYEPYRPIIDEERSRVTRLDRRYGMWKRLNSIERFQPGGRMLEIGCGTGVFLAEAARSGHWELMAVEPSQEAADYVRKELKIPVLATRFSEADLPQGSFDLITLWNVLEHLDNPVADIRRMASLLKKGGWLVFSIPNMESLDAKLFGRYWIGWDLPRHLYFFPQNQLKQILQEAGLRLVDRQSIAGSHAALELSLQFLYRGKGIHNPLASALLHAYHSLPARLATGLPFWIIDQLKLSSVITIFAQK